MRHFVERDFPHLLERIYDAALDPAGWKSVLEQIAACCGGAHSTMYLFDREQESTRWGLHANTDPAYMASFAAYYGNLNPYPLNAALEMQMGQLSLATSLLSKDAVEATEYFNDWMRPQQIPSDHFGAALVNDDRRLIMLVVAPAASLQERNRSRYGRQLMMLVPHLQRAIAINRQLDADLAMQRSLGASLDSIAGPALLLSAKGKPLLLNRRAEAELADPDGALTTDRSGRFTARGRVAVLEAALDQALVQGNAAGPIEITCSSGSALTLWIIPISAPTLSSARAILNIAPSYEEPRALVLCAPSRSTSTSTSPAAIASAFDLSPAEARLAAALASGRSLTEIARDGGFSRNTLRNQLAAVFTKTGTHRQAELVALIGGLVPRTDAGSR